MDNIGKRKLTNINKIRDKNYLKDKTVKDEINKAKTKYDYLNEKIIKGLAEPNMEGYKKEYDKIKKDFKNLD